MFWFVEKWRKFFSNFLSAYLLNKILRLFLRLDFASLLGVGPARRGWSACARMTDFFANHDSRRAGLCMSSSKRNSPKTKAYFREAWTSISRSSQTRLSNYEQISSKNYLMDWRVPEIDLVHLFVIPIELKYDPDTLFDLILCQRCKLQRKKCQMESLEL